MKYKMIPLLKFIYKTRHAYMDGREPFLDVS